MTSTTLHPVFADILAKHAQPVPVETADGWMVVSKLLRMGSVKPPYRYQYDASHWLSLSEAEEHYDALVAGEYRGWQAVAILPCKAGVPLGAKVLPGAPRFPEVSCSQCGQSFGPGDNGFSHCKNHAHLRGK